MLRSLIMLMCSRKTLLAAQFHPVSMMKMWKRTSLIGSGWPNGNHLTKLR